jgi:branched-chain amino acid transport system ATP-binding protein
MKRGGKLELEDMETSYGSSQVLFGVSLAVQPGECITLIGRNGMGKTTTVKSIMGMLQPRAGRITMDGKASSARPAGAPRAPAWAWCPRAGRSSRT